MRILGISGSLRAGSYNTGLLRAAAEVAPTGTTLELYPPGRLAAVPPYDGDVEEQGTPAAVAELKGAIAAADAVLVATPEYNASIPGQLKNALDWVSRPISERCSASSADASSRPRWRSRTRPSASTPPAASQTTRRGSSSPRSSPTSPPRRARSHGPRSALPLRFRRGGRRAHRRRRPLPDRQARRVARGRARRRPGGAGPERARRASGPRPGGRRGRAAGLRDAGRRAGVEHRAHGRARRRLAGERLRHECRPPVRLL